MTKLSTDECRALRVSPEDNVATVLVGAGAAATVTLLGQGAGDTLTTTTPIPFGHKVALLDIARGQQVVKYGQPIGHATQEIPCGAHVHVHNCLGDRGRKDMQQLDGDGADMLVEAGDHC